MKALKTVELPLTLVATVSNSLLMPATIISLIEETRPEIVRQLAGS